MKKFLIAATALGGLMGFVGSASAADYADPVSYDWSGFYIGAQAGWTQADVEDTYDLVTPFDFTADGFLGGALAGYNFQTGNLVLGAEADISFGSVSETALCDGTTTPICLGSGTNPDFDLGTVATIRGRLGYAMDQVLFFGTAGVGFADAKVSDPLQGGSDSKTHLGLVVGGGAEWMITQGASIRLEYLYGDYESIDYALVTSPDAIEFETHSIRAAFNWHF